jgi:hypothetical protein
MLTNYRKLAALAVLLALCVWLVRRNILVPAQPSATTVQTSGSAANSRTAASQRTARRGTEQVTELDPTLRMDLLEAARAVKYQGTKRNIFELYTPPPPPPPPAPPKPANPADGASQAPLEPKVPPLPFKFYGTAQPPGSSARRAFLLDGEDILIAKEGDVVAKFYKVSRIGATSLELEDTRTQKRTQVPMVEE